MAATPIPTRVTLLATTHAWHRWQHRAPRLIRSRASYRTALQTARDTGWTHHACAVYRALGMALLVQDGTVLTCWPITWLTKGHADDLDD
ncbi:MAG: hypothetical protein ACP5QO_16840 [Clostridia bacterium]